MSRHRFLTGLGLFAVLLLLFGRSLSPGHALVPSDLIFGTPFYADRQPPGFRQASNTLLFDQVYQFVPWRHLAQAALHRGRLPLWNPYSYSGTPFIATMQSAVFYPLNVLLNLGLPFALTFAWSALLRLWLAGLGTHALALEYGLSQRSAVLAGLSFMLCAFLITWLGHPHTNVLALMPIAILLTEQSISTKHRRRTIIRCIGLSFVLGAAILGGHPASIVSLMLTVGLYAGIRLFQQRSSRSRGRWLWPSAALITAFGLAMILAAVQLLPFLEWLPLSNEVATRSAVPFRWVDSAVVWNLLTLPLTVMPNLFNNPSWTGFPYWSFLARRSNFNEYALYIGVIAFLAAIAGLAQRHRQALPAPLVAWIILGAIGIGRYLHLPPIGWINQLPLIGLGDSGRSQVTYMLAMALLGAWGVDLMDGEDAIAQRVRRRFARLSLALGLVGLGIMLGANVILPITRAKVVSIGRAQVEREFALRSTHTNPISTYYDEVERMVAGLIAAYRPSNIRMYSSAGIAFLAWGAVAVQRRRPGILAGQRYSGVLLGLTALDMLLFAHGYNPAMAAKDLYPDTEAVAALHRDHSLYRVTVLRQDLVPDAQIMHRFSDVRGLDYPTRWYREYMGVVPDRLPWLAYGEILSSADSPLLRVLNLKYILSARRSDLENLKDIARITRYGSIYAAEIGHPTPRAFLVHNAVLLPGDADVLRLLSTEPERVHDRVLLRDGPDERRAAASLPRMVTSARPGAESVTNVTYEAERSVWQIHAVDPGILFLGDAFYPGWQAKVDGYPSPIMRANNAFRAVVLPAGDHVVSFEYEPESVALGLRLSLIGAALLLALLAYLVATRPSDAASPQSTAPS